MSTKGKKKRREIQYASAKRRAEKRGSGAVGSCIRVPDGMSLFQPKQANKVYTIDVLSYIVGEGNEHAKPGQAYYELTYWRHDKIGGGDEKAVCARKARSKPCYPCQHKTKLASNPETSKELLDSLNMKERQLFLIRDHDELSKGVQLWDIAPYNFGQQLDNKINMHPKYADRFYLMDEQGMTLKIGAVETQGKGFKFIRFMDIEFRKRREALDLDIQDMPCLEDLLIIPKYEKLKELYLLGVPSSDKDDDDEPEDEDDEEDDEDDEEEEPRRKKRSKDDDDEDEDEDSDDDDEEDEDEDEDEELTAKELGIKKGTKVKHEDHGKCIVVAISEDGKSIKIKDSDGDVHKKVSVEDVRNLSKKKRDDDDEDDDDPPF